MWTHFLKTENWLNNFTFILKYDVYFFCFLCNTIFSPQKCKLIKQQECLLFKQYFLYNFHFIFCTNPNSFQQDIKIQKHYCRNVHLKHRMKMDLFEMFKFKVSGLSAWYRSKRTEQLYHWLRSNVYFSCEFPRDVSENLSINCISVWNNCISCD